MTYLRHHGDMNAYSEDLREKIIEALRRGMGKSEAARTFSVSLPSVKRYAKLAEEGRPLAPKKRPGRSRSSTSAPASCSKRTSRSVLSSPSNRGASICGR
jgi:transposase-like protein